MSGYVLDANIFIEASNRYYSFEFGYTFWNQMQKILLSKDVYLLRHVKKEILKGKGKLANWLNSITSIKIQPETPAMTKSYADIVQYVTTCKLYKENAYPKWFGSREIADPWIIACSMEKNATIVTDEVMAKPSIKQPSGEIKIPDVAKHFEIECINLFVFMKKMHFRL